MLKLFLIFFFFILTQQKLFAQTDEEIKVARKLKANNRINKLIGTFAAHPKRAGTRDPDKIFLPKQIKENEKLPLVILLHGIYVTGDMQDQFFNLKEHVDSERFALLLPGSSYDKNGMRFWNATDSCCDHFNSNVDDVKHLKDQIEKYKNDPRIDPNRIIIVGHSNGGFMAQRMACEASELITGIVTFAGVGYENIEKCKPKKQINIIQIHDKDDGRIKYNGLSDTEIKIRQKNSSFYPLKQIPARNLENEFIECKFNTTIPNPIPVEMNDLLNNPERGSRFPGAVENFNNWKSIYSSTESLTKSIELNNFEKNLKNFDSSEYVENSNHSIVGLITTKNNGHMPNLDKTSKNNLVKLILSLR